MVMVTLVLIVEEDNTPPTCNIDGQVNRVSTIQSNYGGCANIDSDFVLPVFDDNSGVYYTEYKHDFNGAEYSARSTYDRDNDGTDALCLDIGTHVFTYYVNDEPFHFNNATDNERTECTWTVTVEDNEAPHVDCHGCQTRDDIAADEVAICTGASLAQFQRSVIKSADLSDYFNDAYASTAVVAYPGSMAYNGFVNCDCVHQGTGSSEPSISVITNTWGDWEVGSGSYWESNSGIRVFDVHDSSPTINFPEEQEDDGIYPLAYQASDAAGNSYTCNIGVTYDITAPTCTDYIDENVAVDENNKNYSVVVTFDEEPVHDATISGKDQGPVMTPQRNSGDVYHVGYAYNATYESIWWITDLAGNNGTCTWRIIVQNPEPCLWPVCDDLPPYIYDNSCPDNIDIHCHENSNCGCGDFSAPQFRDDKFVKEIKVFVDDELFETYNNDESSTLPSESLKIGTSNIRYTAFDMHGQHVHCNFTVTIRDHAAPVVDSNGCPDTVVLSADAGENFSGAYSYSFSHADACSLNENVSYSGKKVGASSNSTFSNGDSPSDTLDLALGTHTFRYTIKDDQGNSAYCIWNVTVNDDENPVISCPDDILVQIEQGNGQINVNWAATATDNDGVKSITYSDYQPGDPFSDGTYTITAVATDNSDNTDTCTFDIVVEKAYEFATLDAALSSVIVSEITTESDSERKFGATLIVTTLVNEHHKLLSQPNGLSLKLDASSNNNDQVVDDEITEIAGECASDAAICVQNFQFVVEFDSCEASGKVYELNAEIDCLPSNCTEANVNEDITVSLAASNYCWQDLASVEVTAEFHTLNGIDYQNEIDNYDASTFTLPSHVSVFDKDDVIGGIIHVTSEQVEIDGVAITSLSQVFYNDADRSQEDASYSGSELGSDLSYESKATIAGFKYTESKLDLTDYFYVTYSATVSVDYAFGSSSRRMLLNAETQRQLSQDDEALSKDTTSDALMRGSSSVVTAPKDAAVVVMKLNNCNAANYDDELTYAIAKYLHIESSRVSIVTEVTEDGYCLAEVAIEQAKCAGNVDILTLVQYLQEATHDSFSELHEYFTPTDVSIDTSVFFVSQTPATIYEAASISSSSTSSTSSISWIYFALAGFVVGVIAFNLINRQANDKAVKHQPLQGERRYSIADLLAANERRSSIDVTNVKLHTAF